MYIHITSEQPELRTLLVITVPPWKSPRFFGNRGIRELIWTVWYPQNSSRMSGNSSETLKRNMFVFVGLH